MMVEKHRILELRISALTVLQGIWEDLQYIVQRGYVHHHEADWVPESLHLQGVQVCQHKSQGVHYSQCYPISREINGLLPLVGFPEHPGRGRVPCLFVWVLAFWVRRVPRSFPWLFFHDNLGRDQEFFSIYQEHQAKQGWHPKLIDEKTHSRRLLQLIATFRLF